MKAEEEADDRAVAALEEGRQRAIEAEEEERAERLADAKAEAVSRGSGSGWRKQLAETTAAVGGSS